MKLDFTSDINKGYEEALSYPRTDRFMVKVHWWSFIVIVIFAFTNSVLRLAEYVPSPFSWRVMTLTEAGVTVFLGLLTVLTVTFLAGKIKNHYLWRLVVTSTLTMFVYLLVFISGGSIEMHFLFFSMLALIAIYADWRLGWVMFVLVGLHHGVLNFVAPTWVYFYGRNDISVLAHIWPVMVTAIFITILAITHRRTVVTVQQLRKDLEAINKPRTSQW